MTGAAGDPAAMPPDRPDGAWHEAVAYSTPVDLAARLAPRIAAATDAGDPVLAVLADDARGALHAALGNAADAVRFLEPAAVHARPAFTVAAQWSRTHRWITEPGGRALVVGQRLEALPGCGPNYWGRLDVALDVATAELPVTVLCPFPAEASQDLVRATHPHVGAHPGTGYRPPHEAVLAFPPPPPPDLGRPAAHRPFDLATLAEVRGTVTTVAAAAGLDPEDAADLVLAVNELASNSIEHGPGAGVLRMWDRSADRSVDGSAVVAEIFDGGHMDVPFPGLTLPPPEGERGRGLWLAAELCDVLQVWSEPGAGTTIRVSMDRRPAP